MTLVFFGFGCKENANDRGGAASGDSETGAVEKYSDENISPQLEDSADRFTVDSVSSAQDIQREKGQDEFDR